MSRAYILKNHKLHDQHHHTVPFHPFTRNLNGRKPLMLVILVSLFAMMTACDDQRIYEKNVDLPSKSWYLDSTITFNFNIPDVEQPYNIYYNIRNTLSFPYQNLYVNYILLDSTGRELKRNLQNIHLFDPKTGAPYGEGLGDIFDNQVISLKNYRFDHPGEYVLQLQQFMRMDTLPEVMSVGVRVEKAIEK